MNTTKPRPLNQLRGILDLREGKLLSPIASRSSEGSRRHAEERMDADYRQNYAVDVDRILHSMAYSRYIDKTQVFYLIRNDHITHRMLHVQLVSKVARTIGRFLGLNEDLIEAIAIGHDIGHTPFGHDGERFLSSLCRRHGIGGFHHNIQSVEFLDRVERKGAGWNLCLQTLDGILCHDGEVHDPRLAPRPGKTFETLRLDMDKKRLERDVRLVPMTMEGCVVRFADTISYIGRDIEDAIRLGLVSRSDIPDLPASVLGNTNGKIVYALVTDVITNSLNREYVAFSPEVSEALRLLKGFNYKRIYSNPAIKKSTPVIEKLFEILFLRFLEDISRPDHDSPIYARFIDGMSEEYISSHNDAEIVRDFIAGMTDQYFLNQAPESMRPGFEAA
ncbi:MAG: HD domain-containing protein [Deltaproteobacteria bacterium]|nr:HD domain-containing protein [Deltaproteobacteria bacterium]